MAADLGSVSWASSRARAGSRTASAAAGSSITATSIMGLVCHPTNFLVKKKNIVGADGGHAVTVGAESSRTVTVGVEGSRTVIVGVDSIRTVADRRRLVAGRSPRRHQSFTC